MSAPGEEMPGVILAGGRASRMGGGDVGHGSHAEGQ